jgi:hypothetical protein
MTGDAFAVLKNVAVTINNFELLCHWILLCQQRFALAVAVLT